MARVDKLLYRGYAICRGLFTAFQSDWLRAFRHIPHCFLLAQGSLHVAKCLCVTHQSHPLVCTFAVLNVSCEKLTSLRECTLEMLRH